jgi:guanine nucleotide-binding protein G(i) subunit alpha
MDIVQMQKPVLPYASSRLKRDRELVLAEIRRDGNSLVHASDTLQIVIKSSSTNTSTTSKKKQTSRMMGNKSVKSPSHQVETTQPMKPVIELPKQMKVILLGTANSGKSTLFRQTAGLTTDWDVYRSIIITACLRLLGYIVKKQGKENFDEKIVSLLSDEYYDVGTLQQVDRLKLQKIWNEHSNLCEQYLPDIDFRYYYGIAKYMNQFVQLCDGTLPITKDMALNCYVRTTGIVENEFKYDSTSISLYDIGGRRPERRKWIHVFGDVTGVIFTVSLTEFCEKLIEDMDTCSMDESFHLFGEIVNSTWFSENTPIILVFTKKDLLPNCLLRYPLPDDAPQNIKDICGKGIGVMHRAENIQPTATVNNNSETTETFSIELLKNLPSDVIEVNIFSYLTSYEICKLSSVSKYMYDVCGRDQVWKSLIIRDAFSQTNLNHDTVISVYEQEKKPEESDYTMKPYKYYYYFSIHTLADHAIQYFTTKFMAQIKNDKNISNIYSHVVNALDEKETEQLFNKIYSEQIRPEHIKEQ